MQDNQSPNHPLLSLQQWLAVLLTLVIILLTIVLSILMVVQFENSLATNLVTIFGLVGTAIGILSLPFFSGSFRLLGAFLHTIRVATGSMMYGLAESLTRLVKHLPRRWNYALLVLSLVINIFSLYTFLNSLNGVQESPILNCRDGNNTLRIVKDARGEDIGISNSQSCKVFTRGIPNAYNAYQAETDIYKNNPPITTPHSTLIVATMLSGNDTSSLSSGTALVQGVDIAQQEYNKQVDIHNQQKREPPLLPLRLLIANAGSNEGHAGEIANQIVQLAHNDASIIGVVGWPFSVPQVQGALQTLANAQIPGVSSSLSSDSFSKISPYFFRVVPPNKQEGNTGASFLESKGVKHVVLCLDDMNDYSNSLAKDFLDAFNKPGNTITKEFYRRGELSFTQDPTGANARMLGDKIATDLQKYPIETEAVYFAGYANDLDPLKGSLLSTHYPQVMIMGGDGLDEYGADTTTAYSNYQDIYFTTFSSYQIWLSPPTKPCFLNDYRHTFNPNKVNNHRGYAFAENDAVLSYDATTALLDAYINLTYLHLPLSPDSIKRQLTYTSFWGVSGYIKLTSTSSDPQNKALYVNQVQDSLYPAVFIPYPPDSHAPDSTQIQFPLCGSI
jgi:ABC-type branched-subunit amino acid transport system substrate-binding protein